MIELLCVSLQWNLNCLSFEIITEGPKVPELLFYIYFNFFNLLSSRLNCLRQNSRE